MRRIAYDVLISVLLVLLQTTLFRFLAIGTVAPDLLLLWIVFLALRQGQIAATTAGFLIGLTLDLLSGGDGMLGLSALSNTVAGFVAGYFFNENKTFQTLGSYQYLLIVMVVSLVHNVIYFLIFLQGSDVGWWRTIVIYGLLASLYTTAFGLLPMFVISRKHLTSP